MEKARTTISINGSLQHDSVRFFLLFLRTKQAISTPALPRLQHMSTKSYFNSDLLKKLNRSEWNGGPIE